MGGAGGSVLLATAGATTACFLAGQIAAVGCLSGQAGKFAGHNFRGTP